MTAEIKRILSITEPEKLFSKNGISKEYRNLAKKYHTDNYATGSHILFTKINELHVAGLMKIQNGTWDNHELIMNTPSGATFKFRYEAKEKTEYGQRFISSQHIALSTHLDNFSDRFKKNTYLCRNYVKTSVKLNENFSQLIPVMIDNDFISELYGDVIVIKLPTPKFYSIKSILDKHGTINHKQATWIISRLMNLIVLFNKSGMTHNGITINNTFINGPEHTAAILDGWWYSTKNGEQAVSIPTENVNLLSAKERKSKIITSKFDIACVKQIGRKLETEDTPIPIRQWMKLPTTDDVLSELEYWQNNVIIAAYGECKFVKWDL